MITDWMNARTVRDPSARTSLSRLHVDWLLWCRQRGDAPGKAFWLGKQLSALGFERYADSRTRGFAGIALRPEPTTMSQMDRLLGLKESMANT
jgi:hypothetical protein